MQIVLISALLLLGTWLRRPVKAPLRALEKNKHEKGRDGDAEQHSPQRFQGDALLVGGLQACHRRISLMCREPARGRAIVGGGYAGLSCAIELADAGIEACVFESAETWRRRQHPKRRRCQPAASTSARVSPAR